MRYAFPGCLKHARLWKWNFSDLAKKIKRLDKVYKRGASFSKRLVEFLKVDNPDTLYLRNHLGKQQSQETARTRKKNHVEDTVTQTNKVKRGRSGSLELFDSSDRATAAQAQRPRVTRTNIATDTDLLIGHSHLGKSDSNLQYFTIEKSAPLIASPLS